MKGDTVYVCQECGKDLGNDKKLKCAVYKVSGGGWYCEKCYAKKNP